MGVVSPHASKDMRHVSEVALHIVLLESGSIGLQCAHTDTVGKHLEIWDGAEDLGDVWGDGETVT